MKTQIIIVVDATNGIEKAWEDINKANEIIMKAKKPSLWQRIKSWF